MCASAFKKACAQACCLTAKTSPTPWPCHPAQQDEGQSLSQLVDQVRMQRAQQLLREVQLPLHAVAKASGFADASSFARAFKRNTGQTPAEHRLRLRQAGG
jgi:AraC-like DNA-binding protein